MSDPIPWRLLLLSAPLSSSYQNPDMSLEWGGHLPHHASSSIIVAVLSSKSSEVQPVRERPRPQAPRDRRVQGCNCEALQSSRSVVIGQAYFESCMIYPDPDSCANNVAVCRLDLGRQKIQALETRLPTPDCVLHFYPNLPDAVVEYFWWGACVQCAYSWEHSCCWVRTKPLSVGRYSLPEKQLCECWYICTLAPNNEQS